MLSFGAMLDPAADVTFYSRFAEERGFAYLYVLDSPIVWREMSPYLTLSVLNTTKAKIGACVTNPVTRNITVTASLFAALQELSEGRMILGLGKGDSAVRRLGERPVRLKEFKEKALLMHRLANGEEVTYTPRVPAQEKWHAQGTGEITLKLGWAPRKTLPLYMAAYGPKILRFAGEVADGVFLQIAEPSTIEWAIGHIRTGAESKGRDLRDIDIVCCTATAVSDDIHAACNTVRGFPAVVANHVLDMLNYYQPSELPANLLRGIDVKKTYDYRDHARSSAEHSTSVSDETAESFTIIGPPEKCAEKLQLLQKLGVTQVCLYFLGMSRQGIESTIKVYADKIMPKVT